MSSEPSDNDGSDATAQVALPAETSESDITFDLSGVKGVSGDSLGVSAQVSTESSVVPAVNDEHHVLNQDNVGFQSSLEFDGRVVSDPTIRNVDENSINYQPEVGDWLLENDDLVPSILSMFRGLVMGSEGLMVSPKDPQSDQDGDLADTMREIYDEHRPEEDNVDPPEVVRQILMDNARYAVSVLRSTDLAGVDAKSLDVETDGETGERIYIQEADSYTTFDISDDGTFTREEVSVEGERALRIGEDVFDAKLYRTAPLQSVADDIVNKMQLKRFKARMAEIASVGGMYIKVKPPAWLPEDQYAETISAEKNPYGDTTAKRLEIAVQRDIDAALQTLQDYQTATIMSIPEHWEVGTVELPQMEESFDDMIKGYNETISRRMLLPFDLLDLAEKGQMLSAAVSAWQREIASVFDGFARKYAEMNNLSGEVEHRFPSLEVEDEKLLIRSLAYSGLLGLSQEEARGIVNSLEGIDLDENVEDREMPPLQDMSPEQKERMSREALNQGQGDGGSTPSPEGTEDVTPETAMDPEMPKDEGDQEVSAARKYSEGDIVEDSDGNTGVVLDRITKNIDWPGGEGETEVTASSSRPAYIVGTETGGSDVFRASDLTGGSIPDEEKVNLSEAEIEAELEAANVPGVEDPEVGFAPGEPEGWTQLSYISAYASVGGSWRSCVTDMTGDVSSPRKWCSALKDQVYGTEEWRGGF